MTPSDFTLARHLVREALQAKDIALARKVTESAMKRAKAVNEVDGILSAWTDLAPSDPLPATIAAGMPDHSRIAFARYLNRVGRAGQAVALLGGRMRSLEDRANVAFNAIFAESLFLSGQTQPARQILDRILGDEADNATALSARSRLLSRSGDHRAAIIDAQRLVTSYGTVADYRVLLADIYRASRDRRGAERTLWDGYRDLPGDESLYREVRRVLVARGDNGALVRFEADYNEEKFSRLKKELA